MKNSTDDSQFDSQKNKKITGKFENDPSISKKAKKGTKNSSLLEKNNLPSIQEND